MNVNSGNRKFVRHFSSDQPDQGQGNARGYLRVISNFVKFGGYVGGFVLVCLIFGFMWFQSQINELRSTPIATADGIAVLTGDKYRIATGLRLLEQGKAARIMISGVHGNTSRAALLRVSGRKIDAMPCCIDVGHEAGNTVENALEITNWAKDNGYNRILVVTSDYHMPRALAEISALAPELDLIAQVAREKPVIPVRAKLADTGPVASKQVLTEFAKYIAALIRINSVQSTL